MLVEFEHPSSDQFVLELVYLIRFVGSLEGMSASLTLVSLLSIRDRGPGVSVLYVPQNAFTVLINERDPTDIDADDSLLKWVEDALHFMDHDIFVSPKLDDFELPKVEQIMQEWKGDNDIEAERKQGAKSLVRDDDSVQVTIFVVDHPVGPNSRYHRGTDGQGGWVLVLVDEIEANLDDRYTEDLNDQKQCHGAIFELNSFVVPIEEGEKVSNQEKKLDELDEVELPLSLWIDSQPSHGKPHEPVDCMGESLAGVLLIEQVSHKWEHEYEIREDQTVLELSDELKLWVLDYELLRRIY